MSAPVKIHSPRLGGITKRTVATGGGGGEGVSLSIKSSEELCVLTLCFHLMFCCSTACESWTGNLWTNSWAESPALNTTLNTMLLLLYKTFPSLKLTLWLHRLWALGDDWTEYWTSRVETEFRVWRPGSCHCHQVPGGLFVTSGGWWAGGWQPVVNTN